jgi:hypothetical protein
MAKNSVKTHESDLIDSFYGKLKISRIRKNSEKQGNFRKNRGYIPKNWRKTRDIFKIEE